MWRRIGVAVALTSLMFTSAVACAPAPKPTVSFAWQPFVTPTSGVFADGVPSGQNATYTFKAANFPANSTVTLQRLQGGRWSTITSAFAKKSGSGTTRPPLGRQQYRLVLADFSGKTLAYATRFLDVYDNFPFSTIFSVPRKHLDGFRSFDYDFRDSVALHKSSCLSYEIVVNNESPTPETLHLVYTFLGKTTPTVEDISIDRAVGPYSIGKFVRPGFDWSITAEGADLYITSNGQQ
jgi:hypothetical protein